jgi:hypothetical protein
MTLIVPNIWQQFCVLKPQMDMFTGATAMESISGLTVLQTRDTLNFIG